MLFDRDFAVIDDVPYNVDPARAGSRLAIVSNQSGVAQGLFPEGSLPAVRARIRALLAPWGVTFAGFSWCPHQSEGGVPAHAVACECRKPAPGMLAAAMDALGADPAESRVIGDILNDVQAGRARGFRKLLIDKRQRDRVAAVPWPASAPAGPRS
ncbi:HAD-IIIA family hydrolase [uncultured Jannaschia sp.]|uniref:HAD-IIIA family hydrolase n=1 Tax=uncultured Jannaschia sp. TaxID=293347 RepID=UPI00262BC09D|nr:HAD-IIIA family hydrolase [uncultured Jannaschia sp.]